MSRICRDTIWVIKAMLDQVAGPESIRLDCDQLRGLTPELMLPDSMLSYQKLGIISESYQVVPTLDGIGIYPSPGIGCNLIPSYQDMIMPLCGNGYLIRREWKIVDWCSKLDTVLVQYIRIEDFKSPRPSSVKPVLVGQTEPHQCLGILRRVRPIRFNDCSDLQVSLDYSYTDPTYPGKIIQVKIENVPTIIPTLIFPIGKHVVYFKALDGCGFSATSQAEAIISDGFPPEMICQAQTRLSVTPENCWARVYAQDLNNGSYDNCHQKVHLAVAVLDSVNYWKTYWLNELKSRVEPYSFAQDQIRYETLIDHWINAYIFRDYVDLSPGVIPVLLRGYESDSIPNPDPHVFPYSFHDWYCYNAYSLSRIEINYLSILGIKDSYRRPDLAPLDSLQFIYQSSEIFNPDFAFEGSRAYPICTFNPLDPEVSLNPCENALFQDCLATLIIEDKFPPTAEQPDDLVLFCDGARFEYAHTICSSLPDHQQTILDFNCRDINQRPYREIEYRLEHDNNLDDAIDSRGQPIGFYGCNTLDLLVLDESGPHYQSCNTSAWLPVYCHRWLCQDQYDTNGQPQFNNGFWVPSFNLHTPSNQNTFLIKDNCQLDAESLKFKDTTVLSGCGTGWLRRTWSLNDRSGNNLEVSQKIMVHHRSDFEVLFPSDTTIEFSFEIDRIQLAYPTVSDTDCETVGITYEDQPFEFSPVHGQKIIRTWTVRDWCSYAQESVNLKNSDVIVDDRLIADPVNRPCVYRNLKDGGDGQMEYRQVIYLKTAARYAAGQLPEKITPNNMEQAIHLKTDFIFRNAEKTFMVYPNWPNPFIHETTLSYYLPSEGPVYLEMRDIHSKPVFKKRLIGQQGINFYALNKAEFPFTGVFYYTVHFNQFTQTRKLIRWD